MSTPVAVTGVGVVSPFGHGAEALWQGLVAGESALAPIRRFPVARPGALGGEVPPIKLRDTATTALARRIDWVSLMALAACRLALADAGLAADGLDRARTGLGLGSAFGNLRETTAFLDRLEARGVANPLVFPNLVFNAPLSYATIELGLVGPTAMFSAIECSGQMAIAWGAELVASGAVDLCLAGGTDELDAALYQVLDETRLLTPDRARPLDRDADGLLPGEGAAVLVLEPLAAARARGGRPLARLTPHPGCTLPAPVHGWPRSPEPLAAVLAPLVADADLLVACASGQPALDRLEAGALARALAPGRTAVTAIRGAVGAFGAAGALDVAVAALALERGTIPATAGLVHARGDLDVVRGGARRAPVRVAVVDGLARGGACRPVRLEAAA